MIQLIEAPPRSGKSYYAVNYLCKFTKYDALYNEYVLDPHVLIISNIEGLKIRHWSLDYCLKEKTIEEFFSIENFENIQKKTGKTHIILAIDECHKIFPAALNKETSRKVYECFAEHGHIGLDVVLMTQGIQSMSRLFNPLLEFVVKVTPRSKKMSKSFTYKFYDMQGKFLYFERLGCKQVVFGAYKSFRHDEQNKPKSAVMIWIVVVCCLLLGGGGLIVYAISSLGGEDLKEVKQKVTKTPVNMVSNPRLKNDPLLLEKPSNNGWDVYHVQGYVEKKGKLYYLIGGKSFPDGPKFRHFDRFNLTVEYHGLTIMDRGRNDSALLREGVTADPGRLRGLGSLV